MPDLADRAKWEARVASALRNVHSRYRDELRALLDANAPQDDIVAVLERMKRETATSAAAVLLLLFVASSDAMQTAVARQTGIGLAPEVVQADAQAWADRRAAEVAEGIRKATAEAIEKAKQELAAQEAAAQRPAPPAATPGQTPSQPPAAPTAAEAREKIDEALDKTLGPAATDRVAVTETTGGVSAAETNAQDRYVEQGVQMRLIWRTEKDAKVCKICSPLEGQDIRFIPAFRSGPPAHPNCRCFMSYEPERTATP